MFSSCSMDSLFCAPCGRLQRSSEAFSYCIECEENLCRECITLHRGFRALINHHIVDLQYVIPYVDKSFFSTKVCIHYDYLLDFFCVSHDSLCCQGCVSTDHRHCDKVMPLQEASSNVKSSPLLSETTDSLSKLRSAAEAVAKNREENFKKKSTIRQTLLNNLLPIRKQC